MDRSRWNTRADTTSDQVGIRRVVEAAFSTAAEADLVDALRSDTNAWIDGLSYVAVNADCDIVGYALMTRCFIGESPALCLAPVAVRPDFQNRGVGSAVVNAVLAAARSMGESFAIVLGHPGFYVRFGFQTASHFGIHLPMDVPDDASMAMALQANATRPAGLVRYPAAFNLV